MASRAKNDTLLLMLSEHVQVTDNGLLLLAHPLVQCPSCRRFENAVDRYNETRLDDFLIRLHGHPESGPASARPKDGNGS